MNGFSLLTPVIFTTSGRGSPAVWGVGSFLTALRQGEDPTSPLAFAIVPAVCIPLDYTGTPDSASQRHLPREVSSGNYIYILAYYGARVKGLLDLASLVK